MTAWQSQSFLKAGLEQGCDQEVLKHAIAVAEKTLETSSLLPPIFSLGHLAHLSDVGYPFLRAVVTRSVSDSYHEFQLRKGRVLETEAHGDRNYTKISRNQGRGFRNICVPSPMLMIVQRWISNNVLSLVKPNSASYAYTKGSNIISVAELHSGCRWMIKLDVKNFFESISEQKVYHVFVSLGYQPLVAFELARLCTKVGKKSGKRWTAKIDHYRQIPWYQSEQLGYLPQGAPTSPMLSNLVMRGFDERLLKIAEIHQLFYSRYADDLCLSTGRNDFSREEANSVISKVYAVMGKFGLSPNLTKTRVVPPGARKLILGMLVDRETPRLSKEFRSKLRSHIHYITHDKHGAVKHAEKRGFRSVWGLRNHVEGLISYACQVDAEYGNKCKEKLKDVRWPF